MPRSLKLHKEFWCGFLKGRVIQEEGLYVYNIHNIEEKTFRISTGRYFGIKMFFRKYWMIEPEIIKHHR
jgi:hypothetical protein